jgi:putative transcriptional regulator
MRYKSEIYEVIHESAAKKFKIGAISEAEMREFDKMCLTLELKPAQDVRKSAQMECINPAYTG